MWLWVGWNILWTFYQPLILSDIIDEVTFVATFREANPGQEVEGEPNLLLHNGMFPNQTVYRRV